MPAERLIPQPRIGDHSQWHERTGPYEYAVFMYHDDADEDLANQVATAFESAGVKTWVSRRQVPVDASRTQRYEEGLLISEHVVVCVTPRLRDTGWAEAVYAPHLHASLNGHPGRRVIPLLVGDGTEHDIPLLLADRKAVKFGDSSFDSLIAQLTNQNQEG